ncbi:uncharacterized protein LOC141655150 [Silene latifolia]|uniref:uncharacterized protein LOC141655150 n=1 Tax=Silene latifolia TaxID=37657 RepID=UPI003D78ACA7
MRSPLVAWEKVCKPKNEGGLGLKNDAIWNKAAVGKLVWWISSKADHLWVRWVNQIYIKNEAWQGYSPKTDASWYWKKLCKTKNILAEHYNQHQWTSQKGQEYTVAKGYECLRDKGNTVSWNHTVWSQITMPKHAFISWLYHHKAMNTNAKLKRLGCCEEDTCYLCGRSSETIDHLFFDCAYSRRLVDGFSRWIGERLPTQDILGWSLSLHGSKLRKDVIRSVLNACIYQVWHQRNSCKFEAMIMRPKRVIQLVIKELRTRFAGLRHRSSDGDGRWIKAIGFH